MDELHHIYECKAARLIQELISDALGHSDWPVESDGEAVSDEEQIALRVAVYLMGKHLEERAL